MKRLRIGERPSASEARVEVASEEGAGLWRGVEVGKCGDLMRWHSTTEMFGVETSRVVESDSRGQFGESEQRGAVKIVNTLGLI